MKKKSKLYKEVERLQEAFHDTYKLNGDLQWQLVDLFNSMRHDIVQTDCDVKYTLSTTNIIKGERTTKATTFSFGGEWLMQNPEFASELFLNIYLSAIYKLTGVCFRKFLIKK